MRVTIIVAIIAAIGGYLHGRRATREELRILDLYMEQLERIQREEL